MLLQLLCDYLIFKFFFFSKINLVILLFRCRSAIGVNKRWFIPYSPHSLHPISNLILPFDDKYHNSRHPSCLKSVLGFNKTYKSIAQSYSLSLHLMALYARHYPLIFLSHLVFQWSLICLISHEYTCDKMRKEFDS